MKQVGSVLRAARIKAGMTQAGAAQALGYGSSQFISNIERGVASLPIDRANEIARLYKIPVRVIIEAKAKDHFEWLQRAVKDGDPKKRVS